MDGYDWALFHVNVKTGEAVRYSPHEDLMEQDAKTWTWRERTAGDKR